VATGIPLPDLLPSFDNALRARRRAQNTRAIYARAANRLIAWLKAEGHSLDVDKIDRRTLEVYFGDLAEHLNPTTVGIHYRHLRGLFGWLEAEDEIDRNPFKGMQHPKVPDVPPAVLDPSQVRELLATCKGRDFASRRDRAILMILFDTGVRLGELVGMKTTDIDYKRRTIWVEGKTGGRAVALGDEAMNDLDRYLRARRSHVRSNRPELWLGMKGALTDSGVGQLIKKRGDLVGIDHLRPHTFRHTWASAWLSNGGQEGDLQALAGWSSPAMVRRYGRAVASDRAIEAHRKFGPGDRL